ncbi:MAG TPA: hypothetical protein VHV29_21140 [Terriglobales bacterium]|jgi:hypothetical protein|nr:hypothetical protein [Terriglobales bacterium]
MSGTVLHAVPVERCDFCNAQPVFKVYSCRNFLVPWTKTWVYQHESVGGWAACRKCAELIDAGHWSELSNRAFVKFAKAHGGIPRYEEFTLKQRFRDLHRLFREHLIRES